MHRACELGRFVFDASDLKGKRLSEEKEESMDAPMVSIPFFKSPDISLLIDSVMSFLASFSYSSNVALN